MRTVVNQYHAAANSIAARAEREGRSLTANEQKGIAYYRASAEKVETLIPEKQ